MFGFFKKSKVEKVNLSHVASHMSSRYWTVDSVDNEKGEIIVNGKYRNLQRDFYKLYVLFVGENVRFKDQRGNVISEVPSNKMYFELKEIMNVL